MTLLFKTGIPNKIELVGLATLHQEALASSRIAELGRPFVENFYRQASKRKDILLYWVLESSAAHPWERVVGLALVATRSPHYILARLAVARPFMIGLPLALYLWRRRNHRHSYLLADQINTEGEANLPVLTPIFPELLYLAIAARWRHQGIGRRLIDMITKDLAIHGLDRISVRTDIDPHTTASGFYEKNAFTRCGILIEQGKAFIVLTRTY